MRKQWILVANGSLARFFSRNGVGDPLMALEAVDSPDGWFKGNEHQRDRLGLRSSDNSSPTAHFEPHSSMRKKGVHNFAHELAQRLEEGVVDGEYETFWLIASSPLLSEIKVCLNQGVAYRLKWTHDADFIDLDAQTLESRLRELREPREMAIPAP